jgi:hypothetical protein
MQTITFRKALSTSLFLGLAASTSLFAQYDKEVWKGKIGKSLDESQPYKIEFVKKAPAGAPNVVWILLDDVGFGAASPFGGLINTPTFEGLAQQGLKYTNFHTTGICSPTRTSVSDEIQLNILTSQRDILIPQFFLRTIDRAS